MSQSFGSWGGTRQPRGGGGFGDAATPPSAAPGSTNSGSMRRAPPARTNAGRFAGAPRHADEDYEDEAKVEEQDVVRLRKLLPPPICFADCEARRTTA
jgi:hypothetical protein